MKTIKATKFECEICGKSYDKEGECQNCEELCRQQSTCEHDWNYRMYNTNDRNNIYLHQLIVTRICKLCNKEQTTDLKDFSIFFKE